ncbi:MAG: lytic transglycosylase domain-containing protein [Rhizobiales bacterium]|nr:lytic transglycosylase domain-containing protein [Hyphomicrobiales bacterium]
MNAQTIGRVDYSRAQRGRRRVRTALTLPVASFLAAISVAAVLFADARSGHAGPDAAPQTTPDASAKPEPKTEADSNAESICLMLESAARAHELPVEFFARVIWQESRFDANAIGPMTRRGSRAQGIAQFMPETAVERGLLDPFDPVQALPKSAHFLQELRGTFGNLGLAAAAYNAGPRRVREWLDGAGELPGETRRYVLAITGRTADEWAKGGEAQFPSPPTGCGALMAMLKQEPNPFVTALERRVRDGVARPWGVQLAAGFSRARALSTYARALNRYAGVLGDNDPMILRNLLRSRGTRAFYQVRVGADTRAAANALCGRLRKAGGACLVLRNRGT